MAAQTRLPLGCQQSYVDTWDTIIAPQSWIETHQRPHEEASLAHPSHSNERSRAVQQTMLTLIVEQLAAEQLTASADDVPGYHAPQAPATAEARLPPALTS